MRHWIIKSHVFVKDTGFSLIGVCPLPWSCISNAEGLPSDGSSHTHFCVFTAVHRLNSWWLAEFRIRQSSRGTKPSCRCMRAARGLETLLVGFACEHTPLRTHTHTHTLWTHTPCEWGKVLASEASMALERQKWKPRAQLVLVFLPTSLSKGWPWYLRSLALAQTRYQTWDPSSPPIPVLYSSRKSITQNTLGSPNSSFPPRNTLSASLPSPT